MSAPAVPNALDTYLRSARRYPLLTREEEHNLAVLWREQGKRRARKKLIESNLRLVAKMAFQYRSPRTSSLDLIQEGNLGLIHAIDKFDPHRGNKISTYACWWIRAYILRSIIRNHGLVKLGTTSVERKLFFSLRKEQAKLRGQGIDPTPEVVAEALGVSVGEVRAMDRRLASPDESLHAPVGRTDQPGELRIDRLPDSADGPDTDVASEQFGAVLRQKLAEFESRLTGRSLEVFRKRLVAEHPAPRREIAQAWGTSGERVRQVELRVVEPLRRFMRAQLGDSLEAAA